MTPDLWLKCDVIHGTRELAARLCAPITNPSSHSPRFGILGRYGRSSVHDCTLHYPGSDEYKGYIDYASRLSP